MATKKGAEKTALAKQAKKILNQVEEEVKKPFTIETTFSLSGSKPLAMKNDMRWTLILAVKTILDRSYHKYNLHLNINEQPFKERINDIDNEIGKIEGEAHLPGMENKQVISHLRDRRAKVEKELEQLKRDTDPIHLYATVNNLKYDGSRTVVEFDIPADDIQLLNKNRFYFGYYKIEMEPIIGAGDQPTLS